MKDVNQIDKLLFSIPVDDDLDASFSQEKQNDTRIIIDHSLTSDDYRKQLDSNYEGAYKNLPKNRLNEGITYTSTLPKGNYYYMLLTFLFLFGSAALLNLSRGWLTASFLLDTIGFYLVLYCFLSLIDLNQFSSSFDKIDPISKRYPTHSKWFPFILLILGACILNRSLVEFSLLLTITLFTINSFGILQAIIQQRTVRSLSLGALLPVRLDEKNLIENSILVLISAVAILIS